MGNLESVLNRFLTYYFEDDVKIVRCLDYEANDLIKQYSFTLVSESGLKLKLILAVNNPDWDLSALIDVYPPTNLPTVKTSELIDELAKLSHYQINPEIAKDIQYFDVLIKGGVQ